MIFRISTKLAAKLKVAPTTVLPLDANPLFDWSAHLFVSNRLQLILVTNTASLYSVLLSARGIAHHEEFIERALGALRELLETDGHSLVYNALIAAANNTFEISKALNRSVTGSMNDMIFRAKYFLVERGLALQEISQQLNDTPFSSLKYLNPREAFEKLIKDHAKLPRDE
jgi:hypothetical protein